MLRVFRRFRQRQMLRIGTNDIIRDRPLEEITRDISRVADAALEVALATALRHVGKRFGQPLTSGGQPARCVILAFGKHGGEELNYCSDIDLMFLYDEEGATRGKRITSIGNDEFFARVVGEVVRLLSAHTDRGQAYRVDLRLRPEGHRGPLARSLASTLSYYDTLGRTWERQALIKVRPVAGDLGLGEQFLQAIEPFVYRKYLSFAEINEIKALKRRIEQKAEPGRRQRHRSQDRPRRHPRHRVHHPVPAAAQRRRPARGPPAQHPPGHAGPGARRLPDRPGISHPRRRLPLPAQDRAPPATAVRSANAPPARRRGRAAQAGPAHGLPSGQCGSRRRGPAPRSDAGSMRPATPSCTTTATRPSSTARSSIICCTRPSQGEDGQAEPESDLILDPNPDPETIRAVLGRYPFRDVQGAYHNLTQLAQESVPFLSTRRCRHFLASIAPRLLRALAETPDPDMALVNLEKVTASLGAKAILWELFSFNPPSLKLYVDLCAWSQFLSEILINNPGMIDELLDSLVLNQPRTADELRAELADLCRGAADPDPILHSFQDKELLRIGVRDILGKDRSRRPRPP